MKKEKTYPVTIDDAKEMIIRHEGLRLKQYKCSGGAVTVGYGHNCDARPLNGDMQAYYDMHGKINRRMADELLDCDLCRAVQDARSLYPGFSFFSEARQLALVDLCFNLGKTRLKRFKRMNAAIDRGDWTTAAAELQDSLWFAQVKTRGPELVNMLKEG